MGILKFLKKDKNQNQQGVTDAPPAPPQNQDNLLNQDITSQASGSGQGQQQNYSSQDNSANQMNQAPAMNQPQGMNMQGNNGNQDFQIPEPPSPSDYSDVSSDYVQENNNAGNNDALDVPSPSDYAQPESVDNSEYMQQSPEMQQQPQQASRQRMSAPQPEPQRRSALKTETSKAMSQQKEILSENRTHAHYDRPIYVEVDDYRRVLDYVGEIKNNIKTSENTLNDLETLRGKKDKEFEHWRNALEDVERKLLFVDKTLFEEE